MKEYIPVIVNGETLYIKDLTYFNSDYQENGIGEKLSFAADSIKKALVPVAEMGKTIKNAIVEFGPDEVELSLELKAGIGDDGCIVFALINGSVDAHISVKFKWKKE